MFLLLCLLFFTSASPMKKPVTIYIDTAKSLTDTIIDFSEDLSGVKMNDQVMAQALHQFVFPDDNDEAVVEIIKDRVATLREINKPSYDNLVLYTLYKTGKNTTKNFSVTDVHENVLPKYQTVKEKYWVPIGIAKIHVAHITQCSYEEYLTEKDKARKRAIICATIASGAVFTTASVLTTYFASRKDCV